jgi:hypothetical protein
MENKEEIFLGAGSTVNVRTSSNVELRETLQLIDRGQIIHLDVVITTDFKTIPSEYHEVFLNMLTTKYYGKVSFGDNPFSKCLPPKEKKWWRFWKYNH